MAITEIPGRLFKIQYFNKKLTWVSLNTSINPRVLETWYIIIFRNATIIQKSQPTKATVMKIKILRALVLP